MVEVTVGQQNVVEALKTNATLENLALGSLSSVIHETILVMLHHK